MFHVPQRFKCCKEDGCLGPEGVERFSTPRLYSCVQRRQRVQHLRETQRNKIDAMPLSGDSDSGGCWLGPNL